MNLKAVTGSSCDEDKAFAQAAEWLVELESGSPTDLRRAEFGAWLLEDPIHATAYDRVEEAWRVSGALHPAEFLHQPSSARQESAARGFAAWIDIFRSPRWSASFASLLLATLVMGYWWFGSTHGPTGFDLHRTALGEVREIALQDGTRITLGADSALRTYRDVAHARRVELVRGDAFFDVAPSAQQPRFLVTAGTLRVRVIGTQFEVQRKPSASKIGVAEGRVEVDAAGAHLAAPDQTKSLILGAGDEVRVIAGKGFGKVSVVDPEDVGMWRSNRLNYDSAPLGELIFDLTRYSKVEVQVLDPSISNLQVSGMFSHEDSDAVLRTLAEVLPIEVKDRGPGRYILTKPNAE